MLPFRNIGGDSENEYFCEGLAEDLLIVLSRVEGLRVAAHSSAFAFRDDTSDVRTIGQIPIEEAIAHAAPLVDKALELDPRLAEAHASRGFLDRLREDSAGAVARLRCMACLRSTDPCRD